MTGLELLWGENGDEWINKKLDSRKWWTVVPVGERGHDFITYLENKYFLDENSEYLELIIGPPPEMFRPVFPDRKIMRLCFIRKDKLPATKLAAEVRKHGFPLKAAQLKTKDVLFV